MNVMVVYVLIDAHPPLVGWGGAGLMRSGYEFINEMLLIVVIEASVEYYN